MENKDWKQRLGSYDSWAMNESMFITIDGETIYTLDKLLDFIQQELDKAREEGYQDCMDDIWEEAKGLRSWAEHDGSISATDIEAGLQEAYLNIESKLKDNK